jgi:hypothetical protein
MLAGSDRDATIASRMCSDDAAKLSTENGLSTLELTAFWGALGLQRMRDSRLVFVLALTVGVLSFGCVEDVRFNPSGCEVHVRGRWLVDGENPTPETCSNIGLVELAIIDDEELQFWSPPEFLLRCEAADDSNAIVIDGGAYIDTIAVTRNRCGGTGEVLRNTLSGEYKSRWRAETNLKFIVDCSPIETNPIVQVDGGTQLLLDVGTVDFQTRDAGSICP